jgi:hypothetical protein
MWRQGDFFIAAVAGIPADADRLKHGILVEGARIGEDWGHPGFPQETWMSQAALRSSWG